MTYVEILAAQVRVEHMAFLYDYHHLISPWAFTAAQIKRRNMLLETSRWSNDASS